MARDHIADGLAAAFLRHVDGLHAGLVDEYLEFRRETEPTPAEAKFIFCGTVFA